MCDAFTMLQVWKIEIPLDRADVSVVHGWALAKTAEEAKLLSGHENSVIKQMPEHLWIARERVVWESRTAA